MSNSELKFEGKGSANSAIYQSPSVGTFNFSSIEILIFSLWRLLFKYAEWLSVQVKSSGSSPTLQSRTVTSSSSTQYITAQAGYDALSQVTVYGDSNLIGSNIKSGVSIFGVSGSLSSSDFIGLWTV